MAPITAIDHSRAFNHEGSSVAVAVHLLFSGKVKSRKPKAQWSRECLLKRKDFSHVKLLNYKMNEII